MNRQEWLLDNRQSMHSRRSAFRSRRKRLKNLRKHLSLDARVESRLFKKKNLLAIGSSLRLSEIGSLKFSFRKAVSGNRMLKGITDTW
eukprot:4371057-Karenia_brevis.AAC.1